MDEKNATCRRVTARVLFIAFLVTALFVASLVTIRPASARIVPFGTIDIIESGFDGALFVAAGDLDGDGDLDVLGTAKFEDDLLWWENTAGNGSVWLKHTLDSSYGIDGVNTASAADIDRDGDLDILASHDNYIDWWENQNGDGSVWDSHNVTGSADARDLEAADIDGDGDLDLLGVDWDDDDVVWWRNNYGDGSSWSWLTIDGSFDGAHAATAGDIDGDGDLDVFAAGYLCDCLAWWENTVGDGLSWVEHPVRSNFLGAGTVAIADLNSDGSLDLLATAEHSDLVTIWWNTSGDGESLVEQTIKSSFDGASSAQAADMDSDGDLDILAVGLNNDRIAWWENGAYWAEHIIDSSHDGPYSVEPLDLDGDGDLDVLGGYYYGDLLAWWENLTIHRSAVFPSAEPIGGGFNGAHATAAGDLDGDGDLDVAGTAFWASDLAWWENDGSPTPGWTQHLLNTSFSGASTVTMADMDGDGDLDVLAGAYAAGDIYWWQNVDGHAGAWTMRMVTTSFSLVEDLDAVDLDRDGDLDVLAVNDLSNTVAWFENRYGDGLSWRERTIDAAFSQVREVTYADLDSDGDPDVLSAGYGAEEVAWWENQGGDPLTWARHFILAIGTMGDAQAADFDGDGDLDVAVSGVDPGFVGWSENIDGSGLIWGLHFEGGYGLNPEALAVGDPDLDGDPDIAYTAPDNDRLGWLENTGDPGAWIDHRLPDGIDMPLDVDFSDVDGDGDPDLLSVGFESDSIQWHPNRGGQFGFTTTVTNPRDFSPNESDDVLKIAALHRGRYADTIAELTSFDLLFEHYPGDPLSTTEANHVMARLLIYRDNYDGVFDPAQDIILKTIEELSLSSGHQIITIEDGNMLVRFAAEEPINFFVVPVIAHDADQWPIRYFYITHVTQSSSTAEDYVYDLPLQMEYTPNVSSGPLLINMKVSFLPLVMK